MSFLEKTSRFEEWLHQNSVDVSPKVALADLRESGQGRALTAQQDIAEDEALFTLPRNVLLNAQNCSLVEDHPELAGKLLDLSQWEALILVVMYEWKVKGHSSWWSSYFDILPVNDTEHYKFDQLVFWSDSELQMLKPSLIVDRIGHDSGQKLYERLFPETAETLGISELTEVSKLDFDRVATLIMSYSFDVQNARSNEDEESEDEEPENDASVKESDYFKSMVPLADTLNADTHKHNASLMYTPTNLVMTAVKPIKAGEQVYNTYSEHPNAEILRRYGYVEANGSKYDFAEVPLRTIKKFFAESTSLSLETVDDVLLILSEIQDEEGEHFVLDSFDVFSSGDICFEFTFIVQFFTIVSGINDQKSFNTTSLEVKARALRRVFKKCYQFLESGKLTKSYADVYSKILRLRMNEYPKSASADFKEPARTRPEMAETVLKSEFQSLKNCLDFAKVYQNGEQVFSTVEDDKLLRNIMKKNIFEGDDKSAKKRKLE